MNEQAREAWLNRWYCPARQGKPCNIVEIGRELESRLELKKGVEPNSCVGDWQAIAHARHRDTNYEELLETLPICWCTDEDGQACVNRQVAYGSLKLAARRLVEPRANY